MAIYVRKNLNVHIEAVDLSLLIDSELFKALQDFHRSFYFIHLVTRSHKE